MKVLEVHLSASAAGEYVVLQNQGLTTLSLRGWALCGDAYLSGEVAAAAGQMHVFLDDVPVRPYTRVVLFTGEGQGGWCPTTDGKQAYLVYWGRSECVWRRCARVHVLRMCASYPVGREAEDMAATG
ncbi:MAG: hypothetical protein IT208_15290 [Chthonomonadales bacterium]|nr:hypothetical protein [Chthonomonadales bacterium]